MKEIESTPTTHPELWSYCWVRLGERWTLQPNVAHEWSKESAFASVLETETKWWCYLNRGSLPRTHATFGLAIEQAEAATADFLRGDA